MNYFKQFLKNITAFIKRYSWTEISLVGLAALLVSSILFLAFPFFDYLKNKNRFNQNANRTRKIKLEKINIKKEEKKKKKLKVKMVKPKLIKRREQKMNNRFKLDLSVQGGGEGISGLSNKKVIAYEEGETDVDARPVSRPAPVYPRVARQQGVEGYVVLRILVNERGVVEKVVYIEGTEGYNFKRNAINAVYRWRFKPALLKNIPVKQWLEINLNFKLGGRR